MSASNATGRLVAKSGRPPRPNPRPHPEPCAFGAAYDVPANQFCWTGVPEGVAAAHGVAGGLEALDDAIGVVAIAGLDRQLEHRGLHRQIENRR
jgi:hypothetical protein